MHIHILGICGTFMGGLAVLAREAGHQVTGCDAAVYPPMSTQLAAQGINLTDGYDADPAVIGADLYVIGNVITRGNPLMERILDRGLPYTSGPQWLSEHVLADKWVLAVAGTHGKTTTTSMLAHILDQAGFAPGFLIGGVPQDFGISARLTDSSFFVIEADEYDTAFFDKRSKFVHYRPRTLILNNLEYDHADIFPDLAAIETQCHHLVRTVPGIGRIVSNGTEAALDRVLQRGCWSEVERFGVENGWEARALLQPVAAAMPPTATPGDQVADRASDDIDAAHFGVAWQGRQVAEVEWGLQGRHNVMNALAAVAAAHHVGVLPGVAAKALGTFRGIRRRMERRGDVMGITVYDDFAHHPTAIRTTIAGLRAAMTRGDAAGRDGRILAVLEPRSNTMKLGVMKAALPQSLMGADLTFAYHAPTGKTALDWNLADALAPLGGRAQAFDDLRGLVAAVVREARPGDQVLVMSNGGFGGVHQLLLDALSQRPKNREAH
ncbi:UDP-N-acetylmuramate:L-alanyl-gamma-D-glutamyl-meso-diaminopimelate ligase [Robbsia andropogonis]|uniref:UDP-N-acetylmuramate:L-alanyl-gamma-D-glutamyl- meso-diaminopimelate ligase n=1 Tax=Robbsia andropogonis TaxID=28092 RepID=UPI002A6AAA39|nr:UDP-N-acetylmuramate:L-alanyl-gamma-D-glutamyl-meso-diaminopimelate ligase [Robbsia andropogonis]